MSAANENGPLEQFIDRTLRDLPARKAPAGLLSRVLAVVEQRETRPWWRRTFESWPAAAQGIFIAGCAALAGVAVFASSSLPLRLAVTRIDIGSSSLATLFKAMGTLHSSFVGSLPPLWIYAALATVAALYFIAFGIGAIAYRSLYASR